MNPTARALLEALLLDPSLSGREREALRSALADCPGSVTTALPSSPALLLTQRQVAEILGVNRTTIWRLTRMGILRPVDLSPGMARYERSQVESLAKEGYRHLLKPASLRKAA
jgi:predicted DNA-binding transcriptional regulator AlpA